MATLRSDFKELAAELIDSEFADFRRPLVFTVTIAGSFNPVIGQMTGGTTTTYSYSAIPQPIDITEWQGTDIAVTDVMVVYTRIDAFAPSVEQQCTYDGKAMQVRQALYDAAEATVKLVLRAL
jgi:hypothetical protein